mgnify:CR=1 FL=1
MTNFQLRIWAGHWIHWCRGSEGIGATRVLEHDFPEKQTNMVVIYSEYVNNKADNIFMIVHIYPKCAVDFFIELTERLSININ